LPIYQDHKSKLPPNSSSGYSLTYYGANLTSGSNHIPVGNGTTTITGSATGSTGVGQFAISAGAPTTGTIVSTYLNVGSASDNWKFVPSTTTAICSASGAAASDVIPMHYLANVTTTTPPGSYSTSITYILTGNF
jgi:hypothetical protein